MWVKGRLCSSLYYFLKSSFFFNGILTRLFYYAIFVQTRGRMDRCQLYFSFLFFLLSFYLLSCKESAADAPQQFSVEQSYNITLQPVQHDEFQRIVPFRGPVSISIITPERSISGNIPAEDSSIIFRNVPSQNFIVTINKEGFYPVESFFDAYYYRQQGYYASPINLYPYPTDEMKVDSIYIKGETKYLEVDEINFRVIAHPNVPADGRVSCVLFFGLDSNVSSTKGTYFSSTQVGSFGTNAMNAYFYKNHFSFDTGTHIYVTARLATGATQSMLDGYSNLEENTDLIVTFDF
jgi:hypothetical protein